MLLYGTSKRYFKQEENRAQRRRNIKKNEPPVEDLREKLNKKRQEQSHHSEAGSSKVPPPDPAYNFLRDPLRGDELHSSETKLGKKKHNSETRHEFRRGTSAEKRTERWVHESCSPRPERKDASGRWRQRKTPTVPKEEHYSRDVKDIANPGQTAIPKEGHRSRDAKDIANPVQKQPQLNIKVEVSFASGERKCMIDTTKTLQTACTVQKDSDKSRVRKDPPREAQKYYVSRSKQEATAPTTDNENRLESVKADDKVENAHSDNKNEQKSTISVENSKNEQHSNESDENNKHTIEDRFKKCALSDDTKTETKCDSNVDTVNQDSIVSPSKDETDVSNNANE